MKRAYWFVCACFFSITAFSETVSIDLTVPALQLDPYHRPYVAVWIETPNRKGVHTIALWVEKDDWYKDLRQWWRKLGRSDESTYHAVTSATRKPGKYNIEWDGKDNNGNSLAPGNYVLCVEASREAGGRDYFRQSIQLGAQEKQFFVLNDKVELIEVKVSVNP